MIPRFKNKPACEGTDIEAWFPEGFSSVEYPYLKRICNGCPAKKECLAYALEYKVIGIWAGTTALDRKRMRKAKGITAKPLLPEWEHRHRA
jgi:WhiB family redox-sensing transcriptional regulator